MAHSPGTLKYTYCAQETTPFNSKLRMNTELLFAQAYQLQYEGHLPQAISIYEQILAQNPNHLDSLHFLGLIYAQLGDMDHAILYLGKALLICPDNTRVLNNLANAYKKTHQFDKAMDYYQRAVHLDPKYAQAHNNLAAVYALQDDYPKALFHYAQAVHAEPDFSAAHFNLGLLLLKNNQLEAARTQFNNVLSLNPSHTEALFYLGTLHLENNDLSEAEHAFQEVLTQESQHIEALSNLGVIALKKQQGQLAVDYFSRALALDNENTEARNNLAATFMHHDRFENALMHYDVLLKKDPDNIEYLYNSGVAQMALGHLNEAIVLFDHILQKEQTHAPALNNLAAIYIKMEQREKAQEYLERALVINPKDLVSTHMLHALTGYTHPKTTPEYAHNLFNNYALYYDQHMKGALQYSIPQHIARAMHQLELPRTLKTLDLGCGTGLTGIVLRELSTYLLGVDIAEKMVEQAHEKGIYDHLIASDINQFLHQNKDSYDLIVAADVLPYFGDLNNLFQLIHEHLKPHAYFMFTTEISPLNPWRLETSARFSHHPDYILEQAQNNGYQFIKQEKVPARIQKEQPLEVLLYVLKR